MRFIERLIAFIQESKVCSTLYTYYMCISAEISNFFSVFLMRIILLFLFSSTLFRLVLSSATPPSTFNVTVWLQFNTFSPPMTWCEPKVKYMKRIPLRLILAQHFTTASYQGSIKCVYHKGWFTSAHETHKNGYVQFNFCFVIVQISKFTISGYQMISIHK